MIRISQFTIGKQKVCGLGDAMALVAQPIARALDAVLGTDLKNCPGCAARRARKNKQMPFSEAASQ